MTSVPERLMGRYRITDVRLEITGDRAVAARIRERVTLPALPAEELTEQELTTYIYGLIRGAHRAVQMLEAWEHEEQTKRYRRSPARRVQILIAYGNRAWAQVVGTGQVFVWFGSPASQGG